MKTLFQSLILTAALCAAGLFSIAAIHPATSPPSYDAPPVSIHATPEHGIPVTDSHDARLFAAKPDAVPAPSPTAKWFLPALFALGAVVTTQIKSALENLPNNSRVQGFTHVATIKAGDLTAAVNDDTQSFTIPIPAKSLLNNVLLDLITPFENTADAANNTTTVSVGDNAGATTFVSATELNKNGIYVTMKAMTGTAKVYTAADTLKVILTPKAGSALKPTINKGELRVYVRLVNDGNIG